MLLALKESLNTNNVAKGEPRHQYPSPRRQHVRLPDLLPRQRWEPISIFEPFGWKSHSLTRDTHRPRHHPSCWLPPAATIHRPASASEPSIHPTSYPNFCYNGYFWQSTATPAVADPASRSSVTGAPSPPLRSNRGNLPALTRSLLDSPLLWAAVRNNRVSPLHLREPDDRILHRERTRDGRL